MLGWAPVTSLALYEALGYSVMNEAHHTYPLRKELSVSGHHSEQGKINDYLQKYQESALGNNRKKRLTESFCFFKREELKKLVDSRLAKILVH